MDDRVFLRILVVEVADNGLHVGAVEKLDDLAHAELIEVNAPAAGFALAAADLEERLHQLLEEGVRDGDFGREMIGGIGLRIRNPGGEQSVRDGLRVHVREAAWVEVMHQRLLERLHKL